MPTAGPFVVLQVGVCSFCQGARTGVPILVGIPEHDASICEQCIALGWELLAEEVEVDQPSDPHGRGCFDFDDRGFREHMDATSRHLASARASRRAAEAAAPRSAADSAREARARASTPAFICTFCGSHRADVMKLICGPGTLLCDECIESATPVIVGALRA